MRDDDLHVGEVSRDVVKVNRFRVLEPQSTAAGHAAADAGMTAVEYRRQSVFGNYFVQRISHAVVGVEALHGRMKLEAAYAALLDQPPRLARAHLALVRIDARKSDHDVPVIGRKLGDLFIWNPAAAHLTFGIDSEHDETDLAFAVVLDRFGNRRAATLAQHSAKVLVRRVVEFLAEQVRRLAARHFGMNVSVNCDQVIDIHISDSFTLYAATMERGTQTVSVVSPRYSASTVAARCASTMRWLIEPLSVTSPVARDGGGSSSAARATRLALPVPSAYRRSTRAPNIAATSGCA